MAAPSYRFPVQQAAFLRAVKEGVYRGAGRSAELPRSVSLVGRMPPVYQQALQGTCVPSAVTALLEYFDDLRTRLSVQFLFAATKEVERNGLERNLVRLRAGEPLDAGFESVFHREIVQLQMLADANGGMAAPVVRPYLLRFEEGVRERFAAAQGCLLQSCFRALETYGVCRYGLWPYASAQGASVFGSSSAGRVEFPPGAREDAEKRRVLHGLYRLGTPNNVDEIRGILAGANGRRAMPVVVTVDFFAGCDGETYALPETEADAEGRLVAVNAWQGRHGLLIVGYMDSSAYAGGGYFIIRNSLGEGWGNRGYGKLPYAYLECFAREAGTILQDLIDYEGDGYGGQLLGEKRAPGAGRRARRMWLANGLVALALVAGTVAVEVCLDDPFGLRRLKPPPAPPAPSAEAAPAATPAAPDPPPPVAPPPAAEAAPAVVPAVAPAATNPPPRPPVSKPKPLVPQAIPPDSGIVRDCRVYVRGRTRTAVDALLARLLPDVSMRHAEDAWGAEFAFRASTQRMRRLALALGAFLKTDVYQMEHGACIEVAGEDAPAEIVIATECRAEVRGLLAQGAMAKNVKILSEKGKELTVLALDRAALLRNLRARFDVRREEDDFWVVRKARAARLADGPEN